MKNNEINPKHKEFMKHFLKNVAPTLSTGEKEILNSLVKKTNQKSDFPGVRRLRDS